MRVEVLMSCEKQDRLRAAVQPVTITPKARPCMHAYLSLALDFRTTRLDLQLACVKKLMRSNKHQKFLQRTIDSTIRHNNTLDSVNFVSEDHRAQTLDTNV